MVNYGLQYDRSILALEMTCTIVDSFQINDTEIILRDDPPS
jgi:hypothetical protein